MPARQMLLGYESELQLRTKGGAGRVRTLVAAVHSAADSIGFVLPYLKRSDIALFYAEPDPRENRKWTPSERLLAYNGARREHSWLRATGRITHIPITEAQARDMQALVEKLEHCRISLEDARAVTLAAGLVKGEDEDRDIIVLVG
jgi:tryptophan synthase beta subunit